MFIFVSLYTSHRFSASKSNHSIKVNISTRFISNEIRGYLCSGPDDMMFAGTNSNNACIYHNQFSDVGLLL